MQQLLTESVFLSLIGGAAGLIIASWLSEVLLSSSLFASFAGLEMRIDLRVLGFTVLISLLTGALFGLAPALQASKPDLVPALKDIAGDGAGRALHFGLRNSLVILQAALSLILLVGAGLFLRSLQKAYATDLGFTVEHALLASVDVGRQGYTEAQGRAFYQQAQERLAALPGVRAVSLAAFVPVEDNGSRTGVTIEGYTPRQGEDTELNLNVVDHHFFQTMGIPLLRGRDFTAADDPSSPPVVVINDTMARRFWPSQDAVGKRLSVTGAAGPYLEVIGVVKAGKYRNLREDPVTFMYFPFAQSYRPRMTLLVRTAGDATAVQPAVYTEVHRLDRNLPLYDVKTLTEHLKLSLAPERTNAMLVGGFGLVSLLLAVLGVYGVMSYAVTQRTREIGIRMALGARTKDVLRLVIGQSLKLAGIGIAIGTAGALSLTRLITSMLYGTSPTDAVTFAGVVVILTSAILLASYLPARRAANVDPTRALRHE